MKNIHQKALQHIQDNEWDASHRLIQDYSDSLSCRIHGYLHRIEGDLNNARYWYKRANMDLPNNSLAQELADLYSKITDNTD